MFLSGLSGGDMIFKKILLFCPMLILLLLAGIGCGESEGGNRVNISSYNSTKSHNTGRNCMQCHRNGGEGAGWFTFAGTVYKTDQQSTYPNTTVLLSTAAGGGGKEIKRIAVDARGNFYTTETVNWGSGIYVSVQSPNETKYMYGSLGSGACNMCHGVNFPKINLN
jgi:mono/diheme cytochrome c family protein